MLAEPDVRFSVVIPTHGRPELLLESLRSALEQTYPADEVIVVSDMDDSKTVEAVQAFSQHTVTVRLLDNREGGGASGSRNVGIRAASGTFVAFLDDDDWWSPEYLERAARQIEIDRPQLVVTWMSVASVEGIASGPRMAEDLVAAQVVAINPGATGSNMIVRTDLARRLGGFDPRLRMKNDTDFLFRLLSSGAHYRVVSEELVFQRKHASGQLTAHSRSRAESTRIYMRKHRAFLTMRDRRHLRFVIHRIMKNVSRRRSGVYWHLLLALLNYSPAQFRRDRIAAASGQALAAQPFAEDSSS